MESSSKRKIWKPEFHTSILSRMGRGRTFFYIPEKQDLQNAMKWKESLGNGKGKGW
jgi:hypothetical protein